MDNTQEISLWDTWKVPVAIAVVALLVRLSVIWMYPDAYQFDAYQRWAGRDHLYIQVWLPATQAIVWTVGKLGGTPLILRLVFAVFGSLTIAMIARMAVVLSDTLLDQSSSHVTVCIAVGIFRTLCGMVYSSISRINIALFSIVGFTEHKEKNRFLATWRLVHWHWFATRVGL